MGGFDDVVRAFFVKEKGFDFMAQFHPGYKDLATNEERSSSLTSRAA
jgi:hypothetical protein